MKCIVIDDEPLARKGVEKYVDRIGNLECCGSFRNISDAMLFLRENEVDVLLLGIHGAGMNGMEYLRLYPKRQSVILITANPEFAVEGAFGHDIVDYLAKPVLFERFEESIQKLRDRLATRKIQRREMVVKVNGINKVVDPDTVSYIESFNNYIVIHSSFGDDAVYTSLKSMLDLLPEGQFVRIHKSFIVNKAKIQSFSSTKVNLENITLPIGRMYKNPENLRKR